MRKFTDLKLDNNNAFKKEEHENNNNLGRKEEWKKEERSMDVDVKQEVTSSS